MKLHATDPLSMLVSLALLMMAVAMMRAWAWAIRRLAERRPLLPPAKLRDVPWGVGSVALVLIAWLAVNFGVANGYVLLTGRGGPEAQPFSFTEQMFLVSLINAALLVIVPALLRATSAARPADLGLNRVGLAAQARIGATAFLLMAPVVYALNGAASQVWRPHKHPLEEMVRTDLTPGIVDLAILSAVVLAPAAEELIFRGVIQGWLARAFRPCAAGDDRPTAPTCSISNPTSWSPPRPRRVRRCQSRPPCGGPCRDRSWRTCCRSSSPRPSSRVPTPPSGRPRSPSSCSRSGWASSTRGPAASSPRS